VTGLSEHLDEVALGEQPLGHLVKELASQTSTLVRQELDLAKAEMTQKGKVAGTAGAMFGAAGILALLGLGSLTLVFIAALATGMEAWLAALIVTVVYLVIAGGLAMGARTRLRKAGSPLPEETIQTLKEDVRWAKTRKQSGPR
jgi:uncharacterized membrane protein YqjE